jgi:ketosteroid isomerase-like protein
MTSPFRGREAVVEAWLGQRTILASRHGTKKAPMTPSYQVVAVDGDIAVVTGTTLLQAPSQEGRSTGSTTTAS